MHILEMKFPDISFDSLQNWAERTWIKENEWQMNDDVLCPSRHFCCLDSPGSLFASIAIFCLLIHHHHRHPYLPIPMQIAMWIRPDEQKGVTFIQSCFYIYILILYSNFLNEIMWANETYEYQKLLERKFLEIRCPSQECIKMKCHFKSWAREV
jgi:hypothetical protein